MKFLCITVFLYFCFMIVVGQSTTCTTPNGEKASCVTLCSCPILREAYETGIPSLIKFVDDSACGNKKFTVCCGTSIPTTNAPTESADTKLDEKAQRELKRKNLLPPRTYCGLQHYDDYFHDNETQISVDEFPWLLDLESQAFSRSGGRIIVCSAVLISRKYALTTNNCIVPATDPKYIYTTRAKLGSYEWRKNVSCIETKYGDDCTDPIKEIYAEETIYIKNTELVLLRLEKTVEFTDYVRPICLPLADSPRLKTNDTVLTTGWGTINTEEWGKKRTANRVGSKEECEALVQEPSPNGGNELCIVALDDIINTCAVTQGGPRMYKAGNNWLTDGLIKSSNCTIGVHHIEPITTEAVNYILDNLKP